MLEHICACARAGFRRWPETTSPTTASIWPAGTPSFSSSLPYHLAQPLASTWIAFRLESNKQGLIERGKRSESANIHLAPPVGPTTSLGCLFSLFPQSGEEDTEAPWGQEASLEQNPHPFSSCECGRPLQMYLFPGEGSTGISRFVNINRAVEGSSKSPGLGGGVPTFPSCLLWELVSLWACAGFSGGLAMEVGGVTWLSRTLVPRVAVRSRSRIFSSIAPPCFWVSRPLTFVLEWLTITLGHCKEGFPCRKLWMGSASLGVWAVVLLLDSP